MSQEKYNVAILGATGVVGEAMLEILAEQEFPVNKLYPLASHRSKGETIVFQGKPLMVEDVENFDFNKAGFSLPFCIMQWS